MLFDYIVTHMHTQQFSFHNLEFCTIFVMRFMFELYPEVYICCYEYMYSDIFS